MVTVGWIVQVASNVNLPHVSSGILMIEPLKIESRPDESSIQCYGIPRGCCLWLHSIKFRSVPVIETKTVV